MYTSLKFIEFVSVISCVLYACNECRPLSKIIIKFDRIESKHDIRNRQNA